nr:hypothetical protein [Aquitalea magnusonii]
MQHGAVAQDRQQQLGTLPADNLRHVFIQQSRQCLQHGGFVLAGGRLVQQHFLSAMQHGIDRDHAMQVIGHEFISPAGPAALQGKIDDIGIADVASS